MKAPYKLKIKIGPHEFEAEGTTEAVQQQFESFKELVARASSIPSPDPEQSASLPPINPVVNGAPLTPKAELLLSKIMRVDGRVVSLTVPARGLEETVLLILFGQRVLRQNDSVTGAELMDGIKSTGSFVVRRIDKLMEDLGRSGDVIVVGEHRSKRYRLTNAGNARAVKIANDLLAILP